MTDIDRFLYSIGMHPDMTDIYAVTDSFLEEMRRGLCGEPSSLKMIPTYLSVFGTAPEGVPVIAIDAGGTNLRAALVTFRGTKPEIQAMERLPMPGSQDEISADEFFDRIADIIFPLCRDSRHIGFCFSYPAEIFSDRDGKILQLNKEVRVRGAGGMVIGQVLLEKLKAKGVYEPMKFTLLNDTAAGLLGGAATLGLGQYGGLAGLILGTGYNCCYMERGKNIKKLNSAGDMIVNCESGVFDKLFRGESDRLTDAGSEIPGDHLLEKMISGAYHGKVITNTARLAARQGLLSDTFGGTYEPFTAPELDDFMRGADNRAAKMCRHTDTETLRHIIDMSFERAARLVCANIAALCLHCDGGKSAEHPFCVFAEGSAFYNSLLFSSKLYKHIDSCILQKLSRHVICRQAENTTLAGAAFAALLN